MISSIRHHLTHDDRRTLTCAFVPPRIDYCKSRWVPQNRIYKLYQVQDNAARLTCRSAISGPVPAIFRALHRLSVESRVQYKGIILTFRSLNSQTPSCLFDLMQLYVPSRQLRSSADTPLRLPPQVFCLLL